jgi:hypothetical protein
VGESHSGATRPSCVRVTMLHPKSTEIRNTRQLSILSAEENTKIAASIGQKFYSQAGLTHSCNPARSQVRANFRPFSHLKSTSPIRKNCSHDTVLWRSPDRYDPYPDAIRS